jgi:hypothetical protein
MLFARAGGTAEADGVSSQLLASVLFFGAAVMLSIVCHTLHNITSKTFMDGFFMGFAFLIVISVAILH